MTAPTYASHPEFVPEWDIYRDANGNPVTVDCDLGYYDGPPLTEAQLSAVRHAVNVHRLVCEAEHNGQHDGALDDTGRFAWSSPNAAKSRLLGRMIHDGKPPTRTRPPKILAEPRWDQMPGGDPFELVVPPEPLDDADLTDIEAMHANLGEPCEHCHHRFLYDDCVACGETWPCSAVRLVAEIRRLRS